MSCELHVVPQFWCAALMRFPCAMLGSTRAATARKYSREKSTWWFTWGSTRVRPRTGVNTVPRRLPGKTILSFMCASTQGKLHTSASKWLAAPCILHVLPFSYLHHIPTSILTWGPCLYLDRCSFGSVEPILVLLLFRHFQFYLCAVLICWVYISYAAVKSF